MLFYDNGMSLQEMEVILMLFLRLTHWKLSIVFLQFIIDGLWSVDCIFVEVVNFFFFISYFQCVFSPCNYNRVAHLLAKHALMNLNFYV